MVAGSHHHCYAITWRITHFWWQFCRSTFYLFLILNEVAGKTYLTCCNSRWLCSFVFDFPQRLVAYAYWCLFYWFHLRLGWRSYPYYLDAVGESAGVYQQPDYLVHFIFPSVISVGTFQETVSTKKTTISIVEKFFFQT